MFVFGTRDASRPYLALSGGRPAALAGFFQRDGDVNTIALSREGADESSAVVYHEYTHLLVGNVVRSIPVWLNEGLAEGRKYKHCHLEKDEAQADAARAKAAAEVASSPEPSSEAPSVPKRTPKPQTHQPWKATTSRGFVSRTRTPRKVGGS